MNFDESITFQVQMHPRYNCIYCNCPYLFSISEMGILFGTHCICLTIFLCYSCAPKASNVHWANGTDFEDCSEERSQGCLYAEISWLSML